ncbi:MAG: type II toxin-antitoxin system RelE/ParE family toxin [Oscillospiraceae bacterium]|nr:type II toxin-antitoxin system RelE/ParE family toxin [Oscillospiraceae bacterium]
MYKVEILIPAWDDLEIIADMHMSLVGPKSAQNLTDGILDSIDTLTISLYGYPTVLDEEPAEIGYRMVIYKKYLCIYRVIGEVVYVYHIADGRTNYPQIIKGYK